MGSPAFNPNAAYSVPAFDPNGTYDTSSNTSAPPGQQQSWYDRNLKGTLSGTAGWQQAIDQAATPPEIHNPGDVVNALGAGATQIFGSPVAHPLQTAAGLGRMALAGLGDTQAQVDVGQKMVTPFVQNPSGSAVAAIPQAILAAAGSGKPGEVIDTAQRAAIGDADAAALRGLHVSPQSPKAQATLSAVQAARPFLQGVQGLQDLQDRIPQAKAEIWQPYQDALAKVGDRQVKGPDGQMTTVADLENRRLELSAQLRALKNRDPQAVQLALQKNQGQAALLLEEAQVKSILDPQLRSVGIDPVAIRKTWGQVSQLGARVAGKTTTGEANQPSGIGRLTDVDLTNPHTWLGQGTQAGRDVIAGRPLWSANPTDLNIREAFQNGGPKPSFTVPTTRIAGLMGRGPIQISNPDASGAIPYNPPAYSPDTQAARLGRLLPAQSGAPTILPYYPEMSGGERLAALMQLLRKKPQAALPAQASPIRLPAPND